MKKYVWLASLCFLGLFACDNSKQIGQKGKPGVMDTREDSIMYAIGNDIGKFYKAQGVDINPEAMAQGIVSSLSDDAPLLDEATTRALVTQVNTEIQQKQMAQQRQQEQQQSAGMVKTGAPAPEIELPTPDGNNIKLSDLRGNYVLVDFWASWCKPCRRENPNVVRMYNKYKSRGFEILGVSLDRTKDSWLKAIEQDGLTWKHVSDLQYWSSAAAKTYGVRSIPYTVLVDPNGNVIATNLRGASLESKLAELLGA